MLCPFIIIDIMEGLGANDDNYLKKILSDQGVKSRPKSRINQTHEDYVDNIDYFVNKRHLC